MTVFWLLTATALVLFMFRAGLRSSPVAYFSAYCYFFLFGPVVNQAFGQPLYRGTVISEIESVTRMYVLALCGLTVADVLLSRRKPDSGPWGIYHRRWAILQATLVLLGSYGIVMAITVGAGAIGKHAGLDAAGPLHYRYLLAEAILVSAFWFFRDHRHLFPTYAYNAVGYSLYCLAFQERDFVFVAFAIVVTGVVQRRITPGWALLTSIACVYIATELFLSRMRQEFTVASLLNQGSTLFVDTFLSSSHRTTLEPLTETYLRLFTLQMPTEIGGTADWFKTLYAPGGTSGYGFSLIGEARYNLGSLGPLILFFMIGVACILLYRSGHWWDPRIAGPAMMFGFMYALRGDIRAVAVSVIFIVLVHVLLTGLKGRHNVVAHDPAEDRDETVEGPRLTGGTGP